VAIISTRSINVLACSFSPPSTINIGISLENQQAFSYSNNAVNPTFPYAEINNCSGTAAKRQYVMVTFGPEVVDLLDAYRGINYNNEYSESSSCSFENNPLEHATSNEQKKKNFENQWKFINKCVEVHVKEMGPNPLVYPKDQDGCTLISTSPMEAKFTGGYCFFKPYSDSQYSVMISVSRECLSLSGFKGSDIDLQDLASELSAYTSSTYKDDLENLTTIGTTSVRISVNPDKSVLKPSDDFGILRPTFPANYQVNDLHLGKIIFSSRSNDVLNINIPFIVDNATCPKNIINGIQSSACDYANPFTGTIILKDESGKEILTWQDGGIAPSNWQGILAGEGFRINKDLVPTNHKYVLEIQFTDPLFSYNYFKNRITQKIGHINTTPPLLTTGGTISEISIIRTIDDIDKMIEISPISILDFKNPLMDLANSRRRLNSYFSSSIFPPIYEKICNSIGTCLDVDKVFASFTASFTLENDYSISNLQITRKSNLLSSYTKKITQQPEYICQ
jgi:hypothetical protein